MKHSIRIKICCITSPEEAHLATESGADALGFVTAMPSGPGIIDEATIRKIVELLPPSVESFLLTSRRDKLEILEQAFRCRPTAIQFCDTLNGTTYAELRDLLPGNRLVHVVHVNGEESLAEAREAAHHVDMLLLDTGSKNGPVKELGGTGRVHDWALSARIREAVKVPVYLAGGLTADNVGEAVRTVRPFGVDLCNGVRSDGRLDAAKLKAFIKACRSAEASLA
jgi:phosphoribosylanthranilate isomerase